MGTVKAKGTKSPQPVSQELGTKSIPDKRIGKTRLSPEDIEKTLDVFKFVSDPTRLRVILILAEGERHVGALCDQLEQSQPAVSHHLALLRHGGVITPRRQGKNNFYSLTDTGDALAKVVRGLID